MTRLPSVQASLAALAVASLGAVLLLAGLALARARRPLLPLGADALLRDVPDALGDAAFLLDGEGRVRAWSAVAAARYPADALRGRGVQELLGEEAAVLLRGIARGPAAGRVELPGLSAAGSPAHAVLVRVRGRPARDLLVIRFEHGLRPPPLPPPAVGPGRRARTAARAELAALGAALQRPIQEAATAAGLLRLSLPPTGPSAELQRVERALEDAERRIRWLRDAGGDAPSPGPVELAALVGELLASIPGGRVRVRAQLTPTLAWIDTPRVRTAIREVLCAAANALPSGGELAVRVAPRSGAAVVELGTSVAAAAVAEAAALARALLSSEGGRVEVEAVPGRGGVYRISLPATAEIEAAAPAASPPVGPMA